MNKEEIKAWLKDNSEYHSRFLDLDRQLVDIVDSLTAEVKKAKVIKISERKSTINGYYAEADIIVDNDNYTVRVYSEFGSSELFHNVYEIIGYENDPKDCYPEYEIFRGNSSGDLIKAFVEYTQKRQV